MKKLLSVLLAAVILLSLTAGASAEDTTQTWIGLDFTMEVPEGLYQLGPNLAEDDPTWALAGVSDPSAKLKEFDEMNVLVNFVSEDRKTDIAVSRKESTQAQSIFDIRLLSQEEKDKFLDSLVTSQSPDLTLQKSWHPQGELLFYRVQMDMAGDQPMHEVLYGTIMNGSALNIDIHVINGELTQDQLDLTEALVNSVTFTTVNEKPPVDTSAAFNTLLLLGLLVAAVAVPLIYIPIKGKVDKKKKAKLAEQLSQYHKTHGNTVEGEPVFGNDTDCTREAIHKFSLYQAYLKNIGEVVFGTLLCVVMLSTAFLVESTWWIRIAAVAVSGYYAYKLIAMPGSIEKVQTKVHSRGQSQTAHYVFYPEAFRVSGVQSASVVPYFQITDIRRWGQYLYLYYGPDNAYLIDQYGFTQGDFAQFEKFIREKTGK